MSNLIIDGDINILYYGGSGGFYFLHQLLLTKQFYCSFLSKEKEVIDGNNENIDIIRKKQFNIKNPDKWKEHEVWPSNSDTLNKKINLRKIYFFCNVNSSYGSDYASNIVLYTDIKSQIRLAYYKKANQFLPQYLENIDSCFNSIKYYLKDKNINGLHKIVFESMQSNSKLNVKFQDILSHSGLKNTLESLNCECSQENFDFMNYYKSLHPKKLLEKIGVHDVET